MINLCTAQKILSKAVGCSTLVDTPNIVCNVFAVLITIKHKSLCHEYNYIT